MVSAPPPPYDQALAQSCCTSCIQLQDNLTRARSDLDATRSDLDATHFDLNTTRSDLNTTRLDLDTTRSNLARIQSVLSEVQLHLAAILSKVQSDPAVPSSVQNSIAKPESALPDTVKAKPMIFETRTLHLQNVTSTTEWEWSQGCGGFKCWTRTVYIEGHECTQYAVGSSSEPYARPCDLHSVDSFVCHHHERAVRRKAVHECCIMAAAGLTYHRMRNICDCDFAYLKRGKSVYLEARASDCTSRPLKLCRHWLAELLDRYHVWSHDMFCNGDCLLSMFLTD